MTKTDKAVLTAYQKGYRVSPNGGVTSPLGKVRKCSIRTRKGYTRLSFTVALGDRTAYPAPVHRLAAFQKFGVECFCDGVVVRHLDGNPLNNSLNNIAIGSLSDNARDRPVLDRQLHAQKAGKQASPYSDTFWTKIRKEYNSGVGYKKLRAKYGVSLSTLSYQLSKTAKYLTLSNRHTLDSP